MLTFGGVMSGGFIFFLGVFLYFKKFPSISYYFCIQRTNGYEKCLLISSVIIYEVPIMCQILW